MRLYQTLLLTLVAVVAQTPSVWSASPEPVIRLEPATVQMSAGSSVEIAVAIYDVENLGAFQFDLTYDPTVVQVDQITLGDFLGSTGRNVNPLGPRINAGRAVYGAFSFGDAAGPNGSGRLATVTLQGVVGGQTPLGLANVQVIDISGSRIPASAEGGNVTVSGTPAPEPAAASESETANVATPTAEIVLTPFPRDAVEAATTSRSLLMEWLITGTALVVVIALLVLAARQMAK